MTDYIVNKTDNNLPGIILSEKDINKDTDVTLFGRTRLSYGKDMNENLLHLLEHFSCPEDPGNIGNPDLSVAVDDKLLNPQIGQIWLNSTQDRPFFWDGTKWVGISLTSDYAANFGTIIDGEQIPKPIGQNGYEFDYDECVWIVSPANLPNRVNFVVCTTNQFAYVLMKYRVTGTTSLVSGCANYMIVGIKDKINIQTLPPTPTPTISVTPSITPSIGSLPTPTPSITPSPSEITLSASFIGSLCNSFIQFFTPCSDPDPQRASCSRTVTVSGGSGSYSYSWSNSTYAGSNFSVNFSGVGPTYTVEDVSTQECGYDGIAYGQATVTITDNVTSQQIVVNDLWYLEYSSFETIDPPPPVES